MGTNFTVLGPVRGRSAGVPIEIGSRQLRLMLALLLARPGEPIAAREFTGLLWGDDPPPSASDRIGEHTETLQRLVGPALSSQDGRLRLDADADSLDLLAFRRLATTARELVHRGDRDAAIPVFVAAIELWQDRCAAGLEPTSGLHPAFVAVERERSVLAREMADAALACGQAGTIRDALRTAASWDPTDGVLQDRLFQVAAARHDRPAATRPTPERIRPAQLPATPRLFTGRRAELRALDDLLSAGGLGAGVVTVAIDGIPGIGKSTLALHWAHSVAAEFPHGQLFADLRGFDARGTVVEPGEALTAFLRALGVRRDEIPAGVADRTALYRSVTAGRRLMVVLDNAGDAEQVRPLIPGSAGCLVLITSRHRLAGLATQGDAHLLTLDVPSLDDARESMRRRLGDARVAADPGASDQIIEGCGRLPLAMAVVAARAAAHTAEPLSAIAAEIRAGRSTLDAFAADEPHSDLRTICSWSYRLLSEPAARLFRLLSVHPGPDFSLPSVASLAGIPVRVAGVLLTELTRTRLLTEHQVRRYVFHDLIRVYAMELAQARDSRADRQAALNRLVEHLLRTAYAANVVMMPPLPVPAPEGADPAVTPEPIAGLPAANAWFATEQSVLAATVAATAGRPGLPAWQLAHTMLPFFQRYGAYPAWAATARAALDGAVALGDPLGEAHMLRVLAGAENNLDDNEAAAGHLQRAQAIFERLGRRVEQAYALGNLGYVRHSQGRHGEAVGHYRQALDLFRRAGHVKGEAVALHGMSYSLARNGAPDEALGHLRAAAPIYAALHDSQGGGDCVSLIADIQHALGLYDESIGSRREAIRIFGETENRPELVSAHYCLAESYQATGRGPEAERARRQALTIAQGAGLARDAGEVRELAERLRR